MIENLAQTLNFLLSFFMWMIAGQVVLGVLSSGRTTFFTEVFRKGTFPVIWAVRRITPRSVADSHIPVLSLPLLLTLRILLPVS